MIPLPEYSGRRVGVFGLGKAGEATVESLLAANATVYAWDDNEASRTRLAERFPTALLQSVGHWPWGGLAALVLGPGVPLTHPAPHESVRLAAQANCPVVGDIELLCQAVPRARKIAITGTNGKSTTTTLIGHLLHASGVRAEVGGNLGTAALSLAPLDEKGVYVLECSSYQADLTRTAHFNLAILLNITPDHLDRHGDMAGYIAAKLKLFANQTPRDAAIIAVDDDHTRRIASELEARRNQRVIRISAQQVLEQGVYVQEGILHDRLDGAEGFSFDLRPIVTLTGRHNWQNAAVAYAAARLSGVAPSAIADSMVKFAGLAHRLQYVGEKNGVRFVNDSKATNADAASHALAPYDNIYWILGGKAKEGGIDSLTAFFPRIRHAFLIGAAQDDFARTLEGKVPYTKAETLENATHLAADMAFSAHAPGVVLLSPACASFDQWKNFEERGEAFVRDAQSILAGEVKRAV